MHIWALYHPFLSSSVVRSFLNDCYIELAIADAELKSYENCYPFIYYIEHGKKYYTLAKHATDEMKPILLFYGMIQLMKACLLTVDPTYPATTAVMAHGVSTRKRKKRNYQFLQDEVKIQKNGLLQHFLTFALQQEMTTERIDMISLFARIPEMNEIFFQCSMQKPSEKLTKIRDDTYEITESLLDHLHMTKNRLKTFLNMNVQHDNAKNALRIELNRAIHPTDCLPFFYHSEGEYYIPLKRQLFEPIHEIVVHYLLLYNLSMICRYETEWWYDLFHHFSNCDLPFIQHFLTVSETKTPYLLSQYLAIKKRSLNKLR